MARGRQKGQTKRVCKIKDKAIAPYEVWIDEDQFGKGTMEPKIKAALYFLKYHGQKVVITSIPEVANAVQGKSGTTITNGR